MSYEQWPADDDDYDDDDNNDIDLAFFYDALVSLLEILIICFKFSY
jgi:hypothetical protein